ncbi:MAG TPA: PEP-utilizing enzyme [Solirubrobacteraceae bacterium]|jgi:pyruvate,water dikinase
MTTTPLERRFPSPFSVEAPRGAEDWRRLYPYYYLFSDERREFEEGKFWFFDGMHNPEPVYPFDTIMPESWWVLLNQFLTRVWPVPPALGIDQRIVNGYLYVSPTSITDEAVIEARVPQFLERAGYYYENWDEIYEHWIEKAEDCIKRLRAIEFKPLPEMEPMETITSRRGTTSAWDLIASYDRLLENMHEMACYHFELHMLSYGALMTFSDFCKNAFPGIADQTISKMVGGVDILFFRPDDELRKLAVLALELGVDAAIIDNEDPQEALGSISAAPSGGRWLESFEEAKEPWFWFSTGPGYCHQHRAWIDDLTIPFSAMRGYIEKLRDGVNIDRPLKNILSERERIVHEYSEFLPSDDDRGAFRQVLDLARQVYPETENHNFYVEHWHHSIFWNKVRDLGAVFETFGYLNDSEDIFFLHRYEVHQALYDMLTGWATTNPPRGGYWREEIEVRKQILDRLRSWAPPPALGEPPEAVTEAATVMLWGITTEMVEQWLGAQDGQGEDGAGKGELRGFAASPGVAEGPARVITSVDQLDRVRTGEILVCPITAPSWAPVFSRIQGAVSDIGGIMSHAAIVSREYGLPAVVGTGFGTKRIQDGERVRVDGNSGVVTVLDT